MSEIDGLTPAELALARNVGIYNEVQRVLSESRKAHDERDALKSELERVEDAYEIERRRVADEQMRWAATYTALRKYGRHLDGYCCGFNGCPDDLCQCVYKGCTCGYKDALK